MSTTTLYDTTPPAGTVSSTNLTSLYSNTTNFTTGVVNSAVYSVNGGTGVTVDPTTGNVVVSIGQDVATTASPTFNNLTLTGDLAVNGGDITTTATTANLWTANARTIYIGGAGSNVQFVDSINIGGAGTYGTYFDGYIIQNNLTTQVASKFSTITQTTPKLIMSTTRDSFKAQVYVQDNVTGAKHSVELVCMIKPSTSETFLTVYSELISDSSLVTFSTAASGTNALELYATPASTNSTDITITRISIGNN